MSFRDVVYAWRDGKFYQEVIKPVADASVKLVNAIVNAFRGK